MGLTGGKPDSAVAFHGFFYFFCGTVVDGLGDTIGTRQNLSDCLVSVAAWRLRYRAQTGATAVRRLWLGPEVATSRLGTPLCVLIAAHYARQGVAGHGEEVSLRGGQ